VTGETSDEQAHEGTGVAHGLRPGRDGVPEADIDLQRDARTGS